MLPWLSSGVVRCAAVLALGWLSLAAIVVATSGTIAGETVAALSRPVPTRMVRLDQADPCTLDPIVLDARLFITPTVRVDVGVIYTDLLVTLTGSAQIGPNQIEQRVSVVEHYQFMRNIAMGRLGVTEMLLRLVERPTHGDTLLFVQLDPIWNGSTETIAVNETRLTCE